MTVLARTAGLLLALVIERVGNGRGFAVAHLRGADFDLDLVLATDALDVDFEVQLAHAGDDGFARLFVGVDVERRVFLAEPLQGLRESVHAVAAERIDRHLDDRLGDEHALERAVVRLGGVGIARSTVETHDRHDVAGLGLVDILATIGVHLHDAAEAVLLAGALVKVHLTLLGRALVDTRKGELAELVVHDLERHADERLGRIAVERDSSRQDSSGREP